MKLIKAWTYRTDVVKQRSGCGLPCWQALHPGPVFILGHPR